MKDIIKDFCRALAVGFGTFAGIGLWGKLTEEETRTKIKTKFIKIKDAIFKKDEES